MKPVDFKNDTYIDSMESHSAEVRSIFAKGYTPNCSEEDFVIKKV